MAIRETLLKAFNPIQQQDPSIEKSITSIKQSFDSLQAVPMNSGATLKNVSLISGRDNLIKHRLGRAFNGVKVMLQNANSSIWHDQTNNNQPKTYVAIQCSNDVICDLWVY